MAKICVNAKPGETFVTGPNTYGVLGINSTVTASSPMLKCGEWVCFSRTVCNDTLEVGKKSDGSWWYSGRQLCCSYGLQLETSSPIQIPGEYCFITGTNHNSIRKCCDGTFWFQGINCAGSAGVIGIPFAIYSSPIQILEGWDFCKIVAMPCNGGTFFGLRINGEMWAWGNGGNGRLGNGTIVNVSSPIQVPGNWKDAVTPSDVILALNSDGGLFSWGTNVSGLIGDNCGGGSRCCPIQIYPSGVTCVVGDTGSYAVVRILRGTDMFVWGNGDNGRSGVSPNCTRSSPIQVPGEWQSICPGSGLHIFARRTDGNLYFVGANNNYQAGGPSQPQNSIAVYADGYGCIQVSGSRTYFQCVYPIEFNKNDNSGTWTLNKVYQQKINDTWSDFIPTIDD